MASIKVSDNIRWMAMFRICTADNIGKGIKLIRSSCAEISDSANISKYSHIWYPGLPKTKFNSIWSNIELGILAHMYIFNYTETQFGHFLKKKIVNGSKELVFYQNSHRTSFTKKTTNDGLIISGPLLMQMYSSSPFDKRLMWSLHYGVKQSDNSIEDFVHGYSLPWELEAISVTDGPTGRIIIIDYSDDWPMHLINLSNYDKSSCAWQIVWLSNLQSTNFLD